MAKKLKFTPQEELFMSAYMERPNATRAAQKANYSFDSAHNTGWRLLQRDDIAAELQRRSKRIASKYEVSAERITAELAKIAFANAADYVSIADDGQVVVDFTGVDRDQMAAIESVDSELLVGVDRPTVLKTRFKMRDKQKALMDLAKLHNIGHANRTELTGADGGALAIAHTVDIKTLPAEDREQLKSVLLGIKARGNGQVTDIEPVDDEE